MYVYIFPSIYIYIYTQANHKAMAWLQSVAKALDEATWFSLNAHCAQTCAMPPDLKKTVYIHICVYIYIHVYIHKHATRKCIWMYLGLGLRKPAMHGGHSWKGPLQMGHIVL